MAVRLRRRDVGVAALFLAPSLIPLLMFTLLPMASSLVLSLYRWDLLRPPRWLGLDNFANLLGDPDFHAAALHTGLFIVGYLPLVYVGGLVVALGLNQRLPASGLYRSL